MERGPDIVRIGFIATNSQTGEQSQAWIACKFDEKTTAEYIVRYAMSHAVEKMGSVLDAIPQHMKCFVQDGGEFFEIQPLMKRLVTSAQFVKVLNEGRRVTLTLASAKEVKDLQSLARLESSPRLKPSDPVPDNGEGGSPQGGSVGRQRRLSVLTPIQTGQPNSASKSPTQEQQRQKSPSPLQMPSPQTGGSPPTITNQHPARGTTSTTPPAAMISSDESDAEKRANTATGRQRTPPSSNSNSRSPKLTSGYNFGDALPPGRTPPPTPNLQPQPDGTIWGSVAVVYYSPLGETASIDVDYQKGDTVGMVISDCCAVLNSKRPFNLVPENMALLYIRSDGDIRSFHQREKLPVSSKPKTLYLALDTTGGAQGGARIPTGGVRPPPGVNDVVIPLALQTGHVPPPSVTSTTTPSRGRTASRRRGTGSPRGLATGDHSPMPSHPTINEVRLQHELEDDHQQMQELTDTLTELKKLQIQEEANLQGALADVLKNEKILEERKKQKAAAGPTGGSKTQEAKDLQRECEKLEDLCAWFAQELETRGIPIPAA